jgi:hypothetical protein
LIIPCSDKDNVGWSTAVDVGGGHQFGTNKVRRFSRALTITTNDGGDWVALLA